MIKYKKNVQLELEQFIKLYKSSTLSERRPIDDLDVVKQMMTNSSLTITAWEDDNLVGISRTLTDFGYVAYLADLAVSKEYQGKGIGRQLIIKTKESLGKKCMLVLLSAPAANEFYPHVGFKNNSRAWVLASDENIK